MNKKVLSAGLLSILSVAVVAGAASVHTEVFDAKAEYTLSGIKYEEEYAKNTLLSVQDGVLKDGDREYAADALVRFPDGSCYTSDEVVLSQEGFYIVEYSAKIDGKVQTETVSFSVHSGVFSVGDSMSSVWYGLNENTNTQAINLSLVEGDVFSYKPVIDLAKVGSSEELIRFKISAESEGMKDIDSVFVRLTDIYDPDIFVTVKFARDPHDETGDGFYGKAAASGQVLKGRNQRWGVCVEDGYYSNIGTLIICSTLKVEPEGYCSISYDYQGKAVYTNTDTGTLEVADLDSGDYFEGTEWKGNFTTGEVYLSLYCSGYSNISANVAIEKILDNDLSELKYVDETAPRINLDYARNDGVVEAVTCRPYKVYEATAFDEEDGYVATSARVYYNYGSRTQVEINVENGAFVPIDKGYYTLVYTARDKAGNVGEKHLSVYADTREKALAVAIDENRPTGQAGSLIKVASATAQNAIGGAKMTVNVYYNETLVAENVKKGFIPDCAGVYKVEYVCNDYIDECKVSYTVQVAAGTTPIISEESKMPRFLYNDVKISLFPLMAYDYSGAAKTEIQPVITVKDDGGERTLDGFEYTPVCSGASTMATIVYSYTNMHGTVTKEYFVPVVKLQSEDGWIAQNYFYGENITASVDATGVSVEITQDVSFIFVKELFDDASLNFAFLAEKNAFKQFDLYLQDSENEAETLKFSFIVKDDLMTTVYINDGRTAYTFSGSLFGGTSAAFNLFYNPYANKLYDNAGNGVIVERALNGNTFNGFSSRKIVYKFDISGVTSAIKMLISSVNGQLLTDNKLDQTPPILMFLGEQQKACVLNGTFKVGNAMVSDVIDTNVSAVLTVKDGNNKPVKDINGKLLMNVPVDETYEVKASEENGYNTYTVVIQAYDGSRNFLNYNYVVNIVDDIAPTIEVSAEKLTAKVNQTITIPRITVADNNDKKPSVYTFIAYKGSLKVIEDAKFTPTKAGVYYIRILAQDKNGNISMKDIELVVS